MPDDSLAALRLRAMRLLARREHSRAELLKKLANHAESAEQLDMLLNTLQSERLLSDARYAAQRVAVRGARYGNTRLKQELRASGVADADLNEALASGGDEIERCRSVWQKKFGELPGDAESRARQMRFLQYRGFSSETIRQILSGHDA